jgi:hypothetical protein
MSVEKLWEDSLEGADYEKISDFAANTPRVLNDASMKKTTDYVRDTGLILTKQQIIDLRKYEAAGLALPHTLKDVVSYLNYGAGQDGGSGLKAADFLTTFVDIRNHAGGWSPLRGDIMLTGSELKIFGASMEVYGRSVEELYEEVKAANLLDKHKVNTLEDLRKVELEKGVKFPGLELEEDTVAEFGFYLDEILNKVKINQGKVNKIKEDLSAFDNALRSKIIPSIKLRIELIKRNSYAADIKVLDDVISRRAAEIAEKNTQYKKLVNDSLGSLAGGLNIFGLGMAIYLGVEAENVKAERNRLNKLQDRDIEVLKNKNQTLGSLKRVENDLQNLDVIAIEAEVATRNLVFVWNAIHLYINASKKAVEGIHDALSLRRFMTAFREVVLSWVTISKDSDALVEVFREADKEYNNSIKPLGMMAMFSEEVRDYPRLNTRLLQSSNDAMRINCVTAEALNIKLRYLPGLFDQFQRLVRDVDACVITLREESMSSRGELETKIRRLRSLQRELEGAGADSHELEEIKEDLEVELKKLIVVTRKAADLISSRLTNISVPFDRSTTLSYIPGLEQDQKSVSDIIEGLNVKLADHQKKLKVVNDAISQLEKNSIEELGKEVNLTVDKLHQLGMAPPEAQIVMFAVEQLKKSIGNIAAGISFMHLIRESKTLQSQVNLFFDQVAKQNKKISVFKGKLEFIQAIFDIDDQRKKFVSVYEQAGSAYQKFVHLVDDSAKANTEERCALFVSEAEKFIDFLEVAEAP